MTDRLDNEPHSDSEEIKKLFPKCKPRLITIDDENNQVNFAANDNDFCSINLEVPFYPTNIDELSAIYNKSVLDFDVMESLTNNCVSKDSNLVHSLSTSSDSCCSGKDRRKSAVFDNGGLFKLRDSKIDSIDDSNEEDNDSFIDGILKQQQNKNDIKFLLQTKSVGEERIAKKIPDKRQSKIKENGSSKPNCLIYETTIDGASDVIYDDIGELTNTLETCFPVNNSNCISKQIESIETDVDAVTFLEHSVDLSSLEKHFEGKMAVGMKTSHSVSSLKGRACTKTKRMRSLVSKIASNSVEGSSSDDDVGVNVSPHTLAKHYKHKLHLKTIGNLQIAEYDGSPKRYGPRPGYPQRVMHKNDEFMSIFINDTNTTNSSLNVTLDSESELDGSKTGRSGSLSLQTTFPIEAEKEASTTVKLSPRQQTSNENQYDNYMYEDSLTKKVLEDFFHQDFSGFKRDKFDELEYKLHRLSIENAAKNGGALSEEALKLIENTTASSYAAQRLAHNPDMQDSPKKTTNLDEAISKQQKLVQELMSYGLQKQLILQQQLGLKEEGTKRETAFVSNAEELINFRKQNHIKISVNDGLSEDLAETEIGEQVGQSRNFTLSPETTDCDSNDDLNSDVSVSERDNSAVSGFPANLYKRGGGESVTTAGEQEEVQTEVGSVHSSTRHCISMPVLEDGLSSGHNSDTEDSDRSFSESLTDARHQRLLQVETHHNPTLMLMKKQISEIEKEISDRISRTSSRDNVSINDNTPKISIKQQLNRLQQRSRIEGKKFRGCDFPDASIINSPQCEVQPFPALESKGSVADISPGSEYSQQPQLHHSPYQLPGCQMTANPAYQFHQLHAEYQAYYRRDSKSPDKRSESDSGGRKEWVEPNHCSLQEPDDANHDGGSTDVHEAIKEIKQALRKTKCLKQSLKSPPPVDSEDVWVPRQRQSDSDQETNDQSTPAPNLETASKKQSSVEGEEMPVKPKNGAVDEGDYDTDQETDRLLGRQRTDDTGFYEEKDKDKKKGKSKEVIIHEPAVLIEGVLFRAKYLGSTQLVCEGQPTKATRMMQAEEAVSRIKAPEGETQPSTDVDLFISTEKIMVLNTDLKEIMMDHALRTISYIADIGDLVVLMARRRMVGSSPGGSGEESGGEQIRRTPKMICHVFESEEAQFIAQSIGQAFQVAYMEFLKANGIEDHSFVKEMDYQEVLNSQEIFGDELEMFAKKELQKEVIVPKAKGEYLGVVIVESGWGSMLPTVVIANLAPAGPAARCGQMNIGDQIIAVNGISLVGLPLSTCQNYIKNSKNQTAVKLTVVPCPPVVEVKIKRPDTKYQLGFSVQNGVICSLLRGGIAERGGVRVGHRIIEINNQSVVAVPHEKIVNMLATSVGEILMKTMPTSMFRLLTGQETPMFI